MSEFTAEQKARQNAMSRKQLAIEAQMIAEGMSPPEAEMAAARAVLAERRGEVEASLPRDAQGRVQLSPQEAAFDNDMALAMGQVAYGNGAEVDNLAAAATPIQMDREFGATTPRQPVGYRVSGPVDSNNYAEAGEAIYDEEELAAYIDRQASSAVEDQVRVREMASPDSPYRGGAELPSQRDRDMYRRGMVPTINPETGDVGYSVAFPPGRAELGRPGALGRRPELQKPVRDGRTGAEIPDSMMYEPQTIDSPLGPTVVYRPSDAYRTEMDRREQVARNHRLAERAGYTPEAAADMATSDNVDRERLRLLGNSRRADARAERQQAVVRRAQAQYNPMEYLNRGDINDWQRMVTANRLLGSRGYRGATPLDVDQAAQTALALREQRLATGEGFQPRTPEERRIIEDRAAAEQRENDPGTAGLRDVQGGRFETKEARQLLKDIAKPFDTNWLGGASEDAFPQIKQRLMDRPYSLPEAQADIAAREAMRQTNWW